MISEVFVTRVSAENYDAYRIWATKIQQMEATFAGYKGVYIQAPEKSKIGNWVTILRFDTQEHLDAWMNSEERKQILHEAESFIEEFQAHRVEGPFAGWFASVTQTTGNAPPIWKQAMLVLLVLYPSVMLEMRFLNLYLTSLKPAFGIFIGNTISLSLVSWPLMPLAIWFLQWWFKPASQGYSARRIAGILNVILLYAIEIAIFW